MRHTSLLRNPEPQEERFGYRLESATLDRISPRQTPWYEDAARIDAGLRWGRRKKQLLAWVHSQMMLRLTPVERRCIELYFFRGLNYRQAAEILGVNPSSVHRGVQRGLKKLRNAARRCPHRYP